VAERLAIHEVASLLPQMEQADFLELVADIRRHGLREPIWLFEGRIIDGRHRYRACLELGLTPQFREWSGQGSLIEFVISMNLRRRHLTPTQRAVLANELKPKLADEARNRQGRRTDLDGNLGANMSQGKGDNFPADLQGSSGEAGQIAGRIANVSPRLVYEVQRVKEQAPELLDLLADDKVTANAASVLAELPAEERAPALEAIRESDNPKATARSIARAKRDERQKQAREEQAQAAAILALTDEGENELAFGELNVRALDGLKHMRGLLNLLASAEPSVFVRSLEVDEHFLLRELIRDMRTWARAVDVELSRPVRLLVQGDDDAHVG
jgi:hypothetical protein